MTEMQYCNRNVNLIDIYPTLIDLCELPKKSNLDGESISSLLADPTTQWHPAVTTDGPGSHSIMSENWHYIIRARNGGLEELYDLKNDPMEWTNLAHSELEEVLRMKQYLKSFVPEKDAKMLPKSEKDKSIKFLDTTIKNRRRETIIN